MTLNPLAAYFAYRTRRDEAAARVAAAERLERSEERAAFLAAVKSMAGLAEKAFDSNRAQSDVLKTFLEGFKVAEPPVAREWDDAADTARYLTRHAADADMPAELKGLDRVEQFNLLLDRMESL